MRNLAKSELSLTIQTGEHSSVEDARAAMSLFRKEKVGFEEESRRRFGVLMKLSASGAKVTGVLAAHAAVLYYVSRPQQRRRRRSARRRNGRSASK